MSVGKILRAAREEQGLTLQHAEETLRIRLHLLQAMESDNFTVFPSPVIARGFIRNYAKYLKLDPLESLKLYDGNGVVPIKGQRLTANGIEFMDLSMTPRPFPWDVVVGTMIMFLVVGVFGYLVYTQLTQAEQPVAVVRSDETNGEASLVANDAFVLDTPTPLPTPTATLVPPTHTPTPIVYDGVTVELVLRESSWIRIAVDDAESFEGIMQAGESRIWSGDQRVTIRAGNAGGVEVIVNGINRGIMGPNGQVVNQLWEKAEDAAVPPLQATSTPTIIIESTTATP